MACVRSSTANSKWSSTKASLAFSSRSKPISDKSRKKGFVNLEREIGGMSLIERQKEDIYKKRPDGNNREWSRLDFHKSSTIYITNLEEISFISFSNIRISLNYHEISFKIFNNLISFDFLIIFSIILKTTRREYTSFYFFIYSTILSIILLYLNDY